MLEYKINSTKIMPMFTFINKKSKCYKTNCLNCINNW